MFSYLVKRHFDASQIGGGHSIQHCPQIIYAREWSSKSNVIVIQCNNWPEELVIEHLIFIKIFMMIKAIKSTFAFAVPSSNTSLVVSNSSSVNLAYPFFVIIKYFETVSRKKSCLPPPSVRTLQKEKNLIIIFGIVRSAFSKHKERIRIIPIALLKETRNERHRRNNMLLVYFSI